MNKQQIIERLGRIKEDIIFPVCSDNSSLSSRLATASNQIIELIADIELDLDPIDRGPEVGCKPIKHHNGTTP